VTTSVLHFDSFIPTSFVPPTPFFHSFGLFPERHSFLAQRPDLDHGFSTPRSSCHGGSSGGDAPVHSGGFHAPCCGYRGDHVPHICSYENGRDQGPTMGRLPGVAWSGEFHRVNHSKLSSANSHPSVDRLRRRNLPCVLGRCRGAWSCQQWHDR